MRLSTRWAEADTPIHVIPASAVCDLGYPKEWIEDLVNLVTACRACNEFLNAYRVSDPVPADLEGFFDLRDRHFRAKRDWVLERHKRERERYDAWRESLAL